METDVTPQLPLLPILREIPIIIDQIDNNLPQLLQPAITLPADVILPEVVSERRLALKRKKQR